MRYALSFPLFTLLFVSPAIAQDSWIGKSVFIKSYPVAISVSVKVDLGGLNVTWYKEGEIEPMSYVVVA